MASIITKASYISTLYLSHNVSSDAWSFFCPNTGDDVINAHRLNCANGLGPPLCRYHNYIYESKAFMEQPQEVGLIRPISPKIDRGPSAPLSQSQPITFTATSSASTERTSQSSRAEVRKEIFHLEWWRSLSPFISFGIIIQLLLGCIYARHTWQS